MITADDLTGITLFKNVPQSERESLAARAADVHVRADEYVIIEGQAPAFFGLLEGKIDVFKSVGGREQRLTTYHAGDYFGEVPLLLGAPALASVRAIEPVRLMRMDGDDFLEMVAHCHVLSGEISRTMATRVGNLRRVVGTPTERVILLGDPHDSACYDLREWMSRNRVAYTWEPNEHGAPSAPAVVVPGGRRLEAPSYRDVADALGLRTAPADSHYDVAIVGGGPAGLAAAVYGGSEGLRTVLIERTAFGGQAGTSSRIENYLGFPGGLSGDELSQRASQQAERFGAELVVTRDVVGLDIGDGAPNAPRVLTLEDGTRVAADAVILAMGVAWKRVDIPGIDRLVGHGVYFGAARSEAQRLRGRSIHLIGGGNSAGQAAMLFSNYAESVTMLVRGPSLAASMSQYLIDQLEAKGNVRIETNAEVVAVDGEAELTAIDVAAGDARHVERRPSDALFLLIGGRAETRWLPQSIVRDEWGYVCTGRDVMDLMHEQAPAMWPLARDPYLLETSVPGVLAAGDVRHGSIKRCAAGVGEGSMAIAVTHQYLAEVRNGTAKRTRAAV